MAYIPRAESHSVASHSDTTATGAELEELTDGSETSLHSHAGGGGGMSLIVQESDQTVNSGSTGTTLVNTELTFSVAANEVWQFEGVLFFSSALAPDIKFAASGPSGAVGRMGINVTNPNQILEGESADLGSDIVSTTSGGNPGIARFWGAIHNGANAGSLTIQFAQNTSDAASTTIHAGSYLKWMAES